MTRLLYAHDDDHESLVFVERERALDLLSARAALAGCSTWGDVRHAVSASLCAELIEEFVAPVDRPPADDAPLQLADLQHWPRISDRSAEGVVPAEILQTFGERYDSMLSSGWTLPADLEDEILEALAAHGFTCEHDQRVADLVDPWE